MLIVRRPPRFGPASRVGAQAVAATSRRNARRQANACVSVAVRSRPRRRWCRCRGRNLTGARCCRSRLAPPRDDVAAVVVARLQFWVGLTQELVVVVAERCEPRDFARFHGSGSPLAATTSAYQSARLKLTRSASFAAAMRAGVCDPMIGIAPAGWRMTNASATATRVAP